MGGELIEGESMLLNEVGEAGRGLGSSMTS